MFRTYLLTLSCYTMIYDIILNCYTKCYTIIYDISLSRYKIHYDIIADHEIGEP